MHSSSRIRLVIALTALAFAACSGNEPTPGGFAPPIPSLRQDEPPMHALNAPLGWPKKTNQPILFAADGPSGVLMFDPNKANGSPEGSIVEGISGAAGLAVDSRCTLYVATSRPTR
ncbi:MAG: hypothetical protein ABSD52_06910 [Candidatus Cybelea sp.]|jgi:hypothetical protein